MLILFFSLQGFSARDIHDVPKNASTLQTIRPFQIRIRHHSSEHFPGEQASLSSPLLVPLSLSSPSSCVFSKQCLLSATLHLCSDEMEKRRVKDKTEAKGLLRAALNALLRWKFLLSALQNRRVDTHTLEEEDMFEKLLLSRALLEVCLSKLYGQNQSFEEVLALEWYRRSVLVCI